MSEQHEGDPRPAPPLASVDRWWVDGFNVLHAVLLGGEARERFWSAAQRTRLIERLARGLAQQPGSCPEVILVFDGRRPVEGEAAHPAPGLELVFAPSADDWIVKQVRRAARETEPPPRLGVVTQDRQVAGRCRHAGAHVVSPGAFLAHFPDTDTDTDTDDTTPPTPEL